MDSRKYSMYMLFFSDSGRCFYSMYRFFLPIPGDVFEAEIIDFVFYVSHRDYIYIYIIFTHAFLHISVQLEGESILTAEMLVKTISKGTVLLGKCW